jgi:hypothetical protein
MQQLHAGRAWQDNQLVLCISVGAPLDAANVRSSFRRITKAVGLGGVADLEPGDGGDPDQAALDPAGLVVGLRAGPEADQGRLVDQPVGHCQACDITSGSASSPKVSAKRVRSAGRAPSRPGAPGRGGSGARLHH